MRWPRAPRQPQLTILSERSGGTHLLQPVGDLAHETVGRLEAELRRIEATDVPEIRVDLGRVQSIDSDGVKLIIKASARGRTNDRRLRLLPGPEAVQRAFRTSGLESRLPFGDSD